MKQYHIFPRRVQCSVSILDNALRIRGTIPGRCRGLPDVLRRFEVLKGTVLSKPII